jgi:hypothetical protein
MSATPDPIQRATRIDGALSARAVLDHFNERGRALLGAGQADAATRISQMLAHEADLSAEWGGLPGTDHPRHWQPDVGDEAALSDPRSEHRRLDVHLPLWWTLPLAVRDREPQRVTFPLAASRGALAVLIRRHMPGGWWNSTVHVALDIETRAYWGARGAVHPHAAARHACAARGDAGRPSLKLMTLTSGRAVETALPERQVDPEVALKLHPGVGWLVAVPVLRFERELTTSERIQAQIAQWWRRARSGAGQPAERDRDPTFAARLKADEAWWAHQLGYPPASDRAVEREARLGASLRPASRPALQAPAARTQAQVIVIHGGLSSVRSGFEAALNTKARVVAKALEAGLPIPMPVREVEVAMSDARSSVAFAPATDGAPSASRSVPGELAMAATAATAAAYDAASASASIAAGTPPPATGRAWPGLPTLDERATWRFEHDTFLGIARNVAHLVAAVRRQCIVGAALGASRHIVLIAHSRGGNVARFGLVALRKAFGRQGWTFAAVTLGSPHLGTQVFERVGHRWHGLAAAVGGLRHLGAPWMNRESLAELVNLERGLAYDVPQGFHDVEPAGVDRMMRGRPSTELPEGMWLVGSHWGPGSGLEERTWDWLFEDVMGAEDEGDGLVQRHSALGGRAPENALIGSSTTACPVQFDASPVFHTHYLVHEETRSQIARMLARALAGAGTQAPARPNIG